MAMPDRIGGPKKSGGLEITVISAGKKPKIPGRIGGPKMMEEDEEMEDMGEEPIGNEQAMDDASQELITALGSMKPDARRVKEALRAFVYACNEEDGSE